MFKSDNLDYLYETMALNVDVGKDYKVLMNHPEIKRKSQGVPGKNWLKILKKTIKAGGGTVTVFAVSGADADVAGENAGMLGTVSVPVAALKESLLEEGSDAAFDAVVQVVGGGDKLIGLGKDFKATGLFKKVDFITSPLPMFILEPKKGGKKIAVVNKRYAEKPAKEIGSIAIDYMG